MSDTIIFLRHILDEIEKIENSTKSISLQSFKNNVDVHDAVIRRIEVIGEATKAISSDLKSRYPEVKWKKIIGTRDILIHAYFSIDMDLTWEIIKIHIPELKEHISKIISNIESK